MKYYLCLVFLTLIVLSSCYVSEDERAENNARMVEFSKPVKIEMGDGTVCYRFSGKWRETRLVNGVGVVQWNPPGVSCVKEDN